MHVGVAMFCTDYAMPPTELAAKLALALATEAAETTSGFATLVTAPSTKRAFR